MTHSRRVLVVDDDTFLRMIVSIELPDWEVVEADRVHEAMQIAADTRPDAVLVDIHLPDGDGLDLVRMLRADPATATLPVLVVTAGHDEVNRPQVMAAGADEYLAKPLEPADLVARLERVIEVDPAERRQRRRDLLERLADGHGGDPDPVTPGPDAESPAPPEEDGDDGRPRRTRRLDLRRVLGGD